MGSSEPDSGVHRRALSPFLKLRLIESARGLVPKGDGTLAVIPIPASYKVSPCVPYLTPSPLDEMLDSSFNRFTHALVV